MGSGSASCLSCLGPPSCGVSLPSWGLEHPPGMGASLSLDHLGPGHLGPSTQSTLFGSLGRWLGDAKPLDGILWGLSFAFTLFLSFPYLLTQRASYGPSSTEMELLGGVCFLQIVVLSPPLFSACPKCFLVVTVILMPNKEEGTAKGNHGFQCLNRPGLNLVPITNQ